MMREGSTKALSRLPFFGRLLLPARRPLDTVVPSIYSRAGHTAEAASVTEGINQRIAMMEEAALKVGKGLVGFQWQ